MNIAVQVDNLRSVGGVFPRVAREQRMGTLIIAFAALILLEGILRKWLLPSVQQPLAFIREPILFLIYAFYARDYGIRKSWFVPYAIFSALLVALALGQALYYQYPLLVPFLGVRFYIFYMPLAFIMGEVMTDRQMGRLLRFLLWASIPVGLLVFLQFSWPVAHPINKGTSDDIEGRFTVVADIVRPYGPFTFATGQAHFAAMMLAILIISFERSRQYSVPAWLLSLAGGAILTMGALSGSRTYFGFAILVVAAYLLAGLTASRIRAGIKRLILVFGLIMVFVTTFVLVFPRAFESMSHRQESAVASEGSTLGRVVAGLTDVLEPLDHAPAFGYGLGMGTNAARLVRDTDTGFALGETEWIRMINEIGPIFGFPVLGLRVLFVLCLGFMALAVNRRTGDGSALILFGFVGYLLFAGQITLQNQLVSICWFAVGMTLAFVSVAKDRP